jgi:hypothetical protein
MVYKITRPPLVPSPPNDGQVEVFCPAVTLDEDFFLRVIPQPVSGIETFVKEPEPFMRLEEKDNHKKDFRWFVDLDKVHPRPVEFDLSKIKPRFFFDRGVFHTSLRSDADARVGPIDPTSSTRRFGKFALEITARILLQPGEQAFFFNGNVPVIPSSSLPGPVVKGGLRYDIVFDCSCQASDDEQVSDFSHVYDVITNISPEERIRLVPEEKISAFNPEVYCMGGNGGG